MLIISYKYEYKFVFFVIVQIGCIPVYEDNHYTSERKKYVARKFISSLCKNSPFSIVDC